MDVTGIIYAMLSLGAIGMIFGVLLGYASKKFEVKVDERVPVVREALPGANCGGCGFAGCDAYAKAVVEEGADINSCTVGGSSVAKAIGEILGVESKETEKKIAFVRCGGDCEKSKDKYIYEGIVDCIEASKLPGQGPKGCESGCLGLGTCIGVCKFDAISIVDGIAVINESKCTNCGACMNICPKGLIVSVPAKNKIRVRCNSKDLGKKVRENCGIGCIGCKICEKNCPSEAVFVNSNLASIDYEKCTQCRICYEKCPTKAITGEPNKKEVEIKVS
ncbi:RnfABCDGE type electron transport complex subunit B [Clostridium sp. MSJ-4]|uniref:Ion-translocating oxidoreductase complex subunit B n=1 Tax=Clostridium simiarum TaxID=2841506 RepID=A0ABS6EWE8_9CLOT|nr:RnfABCDGE type electron transport complex subunit B [Clostridium simiarum]MBU5590547.1 RnfABCDGE type electron transport complex subunit B [Clostridium simiarum]